MNSDYLWDGTGAVDPEVARLEELLSELRYERDWQPVVRPRRRGPIIAALAAAACVAVLVTWSATRQSTSVTSEPAPTSAAAAGTPEVVNPFANERAPRRARSNDVVNPFKSAPSANKSTPRSPGSAEVVDPFKGSPRATHSASKPAELLDPFKGKTSAPPTTTGRNGVVNSWATSADKKSLGASDVAPVIARQRSEIASKCWTPARDEAPKSAPKSARVVLTLRIAASGRVLSATASDPAGYPGLGSCIAGRARNWVFPVSSSGATINVPFIFSR